MPSLELPCGLVERRLRPHLALPPEAGRVGLPQGTGVRQNGFQAHSLHLPAIAMAASKDGHTGAPDHTPSTQYKFALLPLREGAWVPCP